jgi:hypothetical protein
MRRKRRKSHTLQHLVGAVAGALLALIPLLILLRAKPEWFQRSPGTRNASEPQLARGLSDGNPNASQSARIPTGRSKPQLPVPQGSGPAPPSSHFTPSGPTSAPPDDPEHQPPRPQPDSKNSTNSRHSLAPVFNEDGTIRNPVADSTDDERNPNPGPPLPAQRSSGNRLPISQAISEFNAQIVQLPKLETTVQRQHRFDELVSWMDKNLNRNRVTLVFQISDVKPEVPDLRYKLFLGPCETEVSANIDLNTPRFYLASMSQSAAKRISGHTRLEISGKPDWSKFPPRGYETMDQFVAENFVLFTAAASRAIEGDVRYTLSGLYGDALRQGIYGIYLRDVTTDIVQAK